VRGGGQGEGTGQLMDSCATPGTSAIGGRPCLVVWGVGEGEVTGWEMRAMEGTGIRDYVQPGGAPGGTSMVDGTDWVGW